MSDKKLNKTDARQGVETKRMRYVLAISLGLAVVALLAVLGVFA
ncbi:MAG: hypothetical protein P8X75_05990 [Limibacillus sp.]